eukprot:CAMPEP_0116872018 /NCGR_PEP_ID=MMETSP0463-20121206/2636_1 /TAXON_ID=181622 /ORGANISM="Strombidinopsis sp, Strain SopsisLIS2011" /LENGTH=30 /DNA_ID= /DNA_START= /DNA_END= /DNA_ORIENTATION=
MVHNNDGKMDASFFKDEGTTKDGKQADTKK